MDFVRRVMAPRAAATGRQRSTTAYISYVLSRLSVAIQVGNARAANSALQKLRSAAPRSAGAHASAPSGAPTAAAAPAAAAALVGDVAGGAASVRASAAAPAAVGVAAGAAAGAADLTAHH